MQSLSKRLTRWGLELLLLIAIILGARAFFQQSLIEGVAPNFSQVSIQHGEVSLQDYQGKPTLLYFWMKDCAMCELGQDSITKLQEDWAVITIAANTHTKDQLQLYAKEQGIDSWTIVLDESGELFQQYGVTATPTHYVLDGKGYIRFREVGLSSFWGLATRLWLSQ